MIDTSSVFSAAFVIDSQLEEHHQGYWFHPSWSHSFQMCMPFWHSMEDRVHQLADDI